MRCERVYGCVRVINKKIACKQILYLVHPGGGHIQVYQKMIQYVPETYSIYAFRAPGSEEGEEVAKLSISDYGLRYAKHIVGLQNQYNIPMHLLGYCIGGPIAIEIARILEVQGYPPSSLILIDIPNPYNKKENKM